MNDTISTDAGFFLRPLRENDVLLLSPLLEDDESAAYFTERNYKNFHDTKSLVLWLCESGEYFLVIRERDGMVAGIAGTRRIKERPGTRRLAYMLGNKFRGKGLMPDVIRAVTGHSFDEGDTEVIEAAIRPENIRSLRCIEKAGYVFDRMSEIDEDGAKSKKLIYVFKKENRHKFD